VSDSHNTPPAPCLAYLINQYPHVSHSFIRREIRALEARGATVHRFSIRQSPESLVDPADREEAARTHVVLGAGAIGLVFATLAAALGGGGRFLTALRAAVRMGRRSDRGVARHLIYLGEAAVLVRQLRSRGVEHVHAHFGTNPAAVARLMRLLGGPTYSITIHGPEEFDHPVELSLREKVAGASAVVAISDFGRSQIFRWIPQNEWSKVHVVHCGVDAAFLAAGPQPVADNRRLVCVGRLAEQKGQLLLVEAAGALAREGVAFELVFAGDGPFRPLIEQRARELSIADNVRITGWLSNDEVRAQLLEARAMVLPSFAEGLPVVLMEAMALGRPAVTTYVAGIPELVESGVSGWLVPAGSVPALAAAVRRALETPVAELARMGAAGARATAERHDASIEAGRLLDIFRRVRS
jgi:glycosyltransferase involved in cell wall biosynthesis